MPVTHNRPVRLPVAELSRGRRADTSANRSGLAISWLRRSSARRRSRQICVGRRRLEWGLTAEAVTGRAIPYPRGRVIGGSSAVNATIALRGVPADYDEWAALGNDEWSWAKVLPPFRRLEDDPEGDGELHGRG